MSLTPEEFVLAEHSGREWSNVLWVENTPEPDWSRITSGHAYILSNARRERRNWTEAHRRLEECLYPATESALGWTVRASDEELANWITRFVLAARERWAELSRIRTAGVP